MQYAETIGAELVVAGTHGGSGFKRLTLGSTAASVVERGEMSEWLKEHAWKAKRAMLTK